MKESYGEGLAIRTGPESCAHAREGGREALTGEQAGRVFSRETRPLWDADAVEEGGRPHPWASISRDARGVPARSETPGTPGHTSRENRESPWLPVADGAAGRVEKSKDTRR